jgi:hypothetical protein
VVIGFIAATVSSTPIEGKPKAARQILETAFPTVIRALWCDKF